MHVCHTNQHNYTDHAVTLFNTLPHPPVTRLMPAYIITPKPQPQQTCTCTQVSRLVHLNATARGN